jgi:hypothetical protein
MEKCYSKTSIRPDGPDRHYCWNKDEFWQANKFLQQELSCGNYQSQRDIQFTSLQLLTTCLIVTYVYLAPNPTSSCMGGTPQSLLTRLSCVYQTTMSWTSQLTLPWIFPWFQVHNLCSKNKTSMDPIFSLHCLKHFGLTWSCPAHLLQYHLRCHESQSLKSSEGAHQLAFQTMH